MRDIIFCDENGIFGGNIDIENGIIKSVKIKEKLNNLNGIDEIILPQFIDLNIFPKNKNLNRKSLFSLNEKSLNGGVGTIVLNPQLNPPIDNEMTLEFIKNLKSDIEILPLIAAQNAENKLVDISILHSLGGVGIFLESNASPNIIDKSAKYAKMLDIPLFVNCDDKLGGVINNSEISAELGLNARNPLSEIKEIAKMLEVAIFYQIKMLIYSISEARSLELIKMAKKLNPNIFCEISLHHLILNDNACLNYNTSAKIYPPLKEESTRKFFLKNIDRIDTLTSLQCASYNSQKEQVFNEASFGIDCIAHYFPLINSLLIKQNILSLSDIIRLCAGNPARILNLNQGRIAENKKAKLMRVKLNESYKLNDDFLPYSNELFGAINFI